MSRSFAVLGAGSWGTTLAALLAEKGHSVHLWCREPEIPEAISRDGKNPFFLSFLQLPKNLKATNDPEEALFQKEIAVLAIPSSHVAGVITPLKETLRGMKGIINVAKGLAGKDGGRLSECILQALEIEPESPDDRLAVLSGPNLATEIARKNIGATVLAGAHEHLLQEWQEAFSTPTFRVYRHTDRTGVELGGTLKNIFALGAGIVDGLGLGDNAKAAYLTRGLHEMVRLGTRLGGRQTTFYGLSGLGDLMATAASPLSRNHQLGQALAAGKSLQEFTAQTRMVVEGVETARLAKAWGKKLTIPLPITEEICSVLFENRSPKEAATNLMRRSLKDEEN